MFSAGECCIIERRAVLCPVVDNKLAIDPDTHTVIADRPQCKSSRRKSHGSLCLKRETFLRKLANCRTIPFVVKTRPMLCENWSRAEKRIKGIIFADRVCTIAPSEEPDVPINRRLEAIKREPVRNPGFVWFTTR